VGESYPNFARTDPATFQRAYALLDLRASLSHDVWEANFFVTNVLDKQAALSQFISGNYSATTRTRMYTNQPRTTGLSLRWKF
jgi:outer membrane receptor protein involved in Fe transport